MLGVAERACNALYRARVYLELGRRLAHAHAARQSHCLKGRHAARQADLAWVLKADLESGTSNGVALPQPGCSRRWVESENVQDQGARE